MQESKLTLKSALQANGYIADDDLTTTIVLMEKLQRPLLIEGEAGVGKTEIAKALAAINECPLIRLQCYEGLDTNAAVYEWDYSKQLLSIKLHEQLESKEHIAIPDIFNEEFLLERPLLKAIRQERSPILLIDEIDRADEAFEAYLLELLSDFQITIPELGTIRAKSHPLVILTSNNTRDLSDALRRRCLYHYMDYPDFDKELLIINTRIPEIGQSLAEQIAKFIQNVRKLDLRKKPGIAESLDWAAALFGLGITELEQHIDSVLQTRACLVKTQEDLELLDKNTIQNLLAKSA